MQHYNFDEPEPRTSIVLGLITCILIVAAAALLGKAMVNIQAALINKPDVGIYLLLPELELGQTELLRDMGDERDYWADSNKGELLVHLEKKGNEWVVGSYEELHPTASGATL